MHKRIFYKYRPINNNTINILEKRILRYSFPQEFNDPFDCYVRSNYSSKNPEDWKRYFDRLPLDPLMKIYNYKKAEELDFDVEKIFRSNKELIRDNYNDMIIVCCFSSIKSSLPMWAHYANNHTGICLGFITIPNKEKNEIVPMLEMDEIIIPDLEPPFRNYAPIFKIEYKDHLPPPYNGLTDSPEETFKFMKTKHKDWLYEKEYRSLLLYNGHRRDLKFKKKSLAEIIFGIKTPELDKEKIKNIIRDNYLNEGLKVNLFQAEHTLTDYKINFVPIEI